MGARRMQTEKGGKSGMNEMKQVRTPELIGSEIRMYVDAGRRVTLLCGIEIGRRLVEAKELLAHGEWLPWLERETSFSDRSAQRYMKVFEEYGASQLGLFGPETNATTLSDLPISKALLLLSVPESEREEFAAEVKADEISTRELEKVIAEKKAAEERALAAEKALHELKESEGLAVAELEEKIYNLQEDAARGREALKEREKLQDKLTAAGQTELNLREQIKELENRPIEVAVQRDEKAIEEAVQQAKADASAEWSAKVKKLQEDLEKANAQKDKLKAKVDKADAAAAEKLAAAERETARIRQELEATQKKLKASNGNVAAFGVYFKSVQENFNSMMEKVREIGEEDQETAKKLCGAARVILTKAIERLGTEE